MVKGRIEDTAVPVAEGTDLHLTQLGIPFRSGCILRLDEVPARQLRLHVLHGITGAYRRQGNLKEDLAGPAEIQYTFYRLTPQLGICSRDVVVIGCKLQDPRIALQDKIHLAVRTPAVIITITFYRIIIHLAGIAGIGLVPVALMKVDHHVGGFPRRVCIAVEAHAGRGCQLRADLVLVQQH